MDAGKSIEYFLPAGIGVLLPMKKRMDIWEDAWALGQRCPWQRLVGVAPLPKVPPSHSPEGIAKRELKKASNRSSS